MASQGPNNPSTYATVSYGIWDWSNTSNVASSNDSHATASIARNAKSYYLDVTNFGFSIPSGVTIDGIKVEIEQKSSAANRQRDDTVVIIKGGTAGATNKANVTDWPTTDTYQTYGGAADLWSETWAYTDINASNFGVRIAVKDISGVFTSTASIDHIRITVYYTASGSALTKDLSDTFTIADSAVKKPHKKPTDTMTLADSRVQYPKKNILETMTLADVLSKANKKNLLDSMAVAESASNKPSLNEADSIAIADAAVKGIGLKKFEDFSITDSFARLVTFLRSITDTVAIADLFSGKPNKVFSDTMAIVDESSSEDIDQENLSGAVSIGFGDIGSGRDYLSQGFKPTLDNITAIAFHLNAKSGTSTQGYKVWIDEADANSVPLNGIGGIGGVTLILNADLVTGALTKYTLTAPVTGLTPGNQYCFVIAPWNTTLDIYSTDYQDFLSSVSNPYPDGRRTHGDTLYSTWVAPDSGNADLLFRTYGNVGGAGLVKAIGKNSVDTVTLADAYTAVFGKTITDSLTISDTLKNAPLKLLTDNMTLSDEMLAEILLFVALNDTLNITDVSIRGVVKNLTDSVALADVLANSFKLNKADTLTLADSILKILSKPISDSLTISDLVIKTSGKNITELVSIAEAMAKVIGINKTDTYVLADLIVKIARVNQSDTLTIIDVINQGGYIYPNDTITLIDALSKATSKPLSDSLNVADVISKGTGKAFTENVAVSDSLIKTLGKGIADIVSIADSLVRAVVKRITDTLSITDLFEYVSSAIVPAERIYQAIGDRIKRARGAFSSRSTMTKKKTDASDNKDDIFKKKLF